MELLPPPETMYRALLARDRSFEGIFFFGVRTTGIFCRPTCAAKKPARANVEFFGAAGDALQVGYRPCLRCRPTDVTVSIPEAIERLRAEVERAPGGRLTDKELAALKIDPSTARRQFKRHFGMTFQAYHRTSRVAAALQKPRGGETVQALANRSGFASASGFREACSRLFGGAPTTLQSASCLYVDRMDSPLGQLVAIADDEGLRLLEFSDRTCLEREVVTLRRRLRASVVPGDHPHLRTLRAELSEYFGGSKLHFEVPLAPIGSDFQQRAWRVLRSIPVGETRSYSWMAEHLGVPRARRAMGRASGSNMLCIVIPCHRVIRADGTLCGYAGGLWRKKWLLDHERRCSRRADGGTGSVG